MLIALAYHHTRVLPIQLQHLPRHPRRIGQPARCGGDGGLVIANNRIHAGRRELAGKAGHHLGAPAAMLVIGRREDQH